MPEIIRNALIATEHGIASAVRPKVYDELIRSPSGRCRPDRHIDELRASIVMENEPAARGCLDPCRSGNVRGKIECRGCRSQVDIVIRPVKIHRAPDLSGAPGMTAPSERAGIAVAARVGRTRAARIIELPVPDEPVRERIPEIRADLHARVRLLPVPVPAADHSHDQDDSKILERAAEEEVVFISGHISDNFQFLISNFPAYRQAGR